VLPLCYSFPADDDANVRWLGGAAAVPALAAALRALPRLRTALVSRMGPGTRLAPHQGWAEISNHVLRVHVPLALPAPGATGVVVDGETRAHALGDALVFDDSRVHSAFNAHETGERTVLILDIARPDGVPPGVATLGATPELNDLIALFS
jgi:aspartyl/asparaginyl beta-hydroxylase (cupin superfamily)